MRQGTTVKQGDDEARSDNKAGSAAYSRARICRVSAAERLAG